MSIACTSRRHDVHTKGTKILLFLITALASLAISFQVSAYAQQSAKPLVYITGQIRNPGSYEFKDGMTAGQLVALAGGVTQRGSTSTIVITRKSSNGSQLETVDANVDSLLRVLDVVSIGIRKKS